MRRGLGAAICLLAAGAALRGIGTVAAQTPDQPPPAMACLARYYDLTPVSRDGAWFGRLPDGQLLPWDDGIRKDDDERLEHPDLQDMLSTSYAPGPIRPVTDPAQDPGRVRVDALFAATYGRSSQQRQVRRVPFVAGQSVLIHRRAAPALARVAQRLTRALAAEPSLRAYLQPLAGSIVERRIAGTDRTSAHTYGIALDINTRRSDYWRWQRTGALQWRNRIPQTIVDAFEAEGFIWGGRWHHFDTMHFEYRPELLDVQCQQRAD